MDANIADGGLAKSFWIAMWKRLSNMVGSLHVWECIILNGVGQLHHIIGNMNAVQYCQILTEGLLGTLHDYNTNSNNIIFQQDNNSEHTSKKVWVWFSDHGFEVLSWPPQFPDMSIIEPVWEHLDCLVHARDPLPCNLNKLFAAL